MTPRAGFLPLLVSLFPLATLAEDRTWTNKIGQNRVLAEFVDCTGSQVWLKPVDGPTFSIPAEELTRRERNSVICRRLSQTELSGEIARVTGRYSPQRIQELVRPWRESVDLVGRGLPGYPRWMEVSLEQRGQELEADMVRLMCLYSGNEVTDVGLLSVVVAYRRSVEGLLHFLKTRLESLPRASKRSPKALEKELTGELDLFEIRLAKISKRAESLIRQ